MDNKVQEFLNDNFGEVRCFSDKLNNPWFCANDCLKILKYEESGWRKTISRKCNKKGVEKIKVATKRGNQSLNFINEHNLLNLISESRTVTSEFKIKFREWLISKNLLTHVNFYSERKEIKFLDKLEEVLKSFDIVGEKQYTVKNKSGTNYRIDYYIPELNIAIEYDENGHADYTYEQHEGRQEYIENKLDCNFIRVTDKESDEYNIGIVLKEIFEIYNRSSINEYKNDMVSEGFLTSFNIKNEFCGINEYFKQNDDMLINIKSIIKENFENILLNDLYLCVYIISDNLYITLESGSNEVIKVQKCL